MTKLEHYNKLLEQGKITKEEYEDLLNDLKLIEETKNDRY